MNTKRALLDKFAKKYLHKDLVMKNWKDLAEWSKDQGSMLMFSEEDLEQLASIAAAEIEKVRREKK